MEDPAHPLAPQPATSHFDLWVPQGTYRIAAYTSELSRGWTLDASPLMTIVRDLDLTADRGLVVDLPRRQVAVTMAIADPTGSVERSSRIRLHARDADPRSRWDVPVTDATLHFVREPIAIDAWPGTYDVEYESLSAAWPDSASALPAGRLPLGCWTIAP